MKSELEKLRDVAATVRPVARRLFNDVALMLPEEQNEVVALCDALHELDAEPREAPTCTGYAVGPEELRAIDQRVIQVLSGLQLYEPRGAEDGAFAADVAILSGFVRGELREAVHRMHQPATPLFNRATMAVLARTGTVYVEEPDGSVRGVAVVGLRDAPAPGRVEGDIPRMARGTAGSPLRNGREVPADPREAPACDDATEQERSEIIDATIGEVVKQS